MVQILVAFFEPLTLSTTSTTPLSAFGASISSIFIPEITMPIPTSVVSQLVPLVTVSEVETPTEEDITYFGDDAVVSLWDYFCSRSKKVVVKKGCKRTREGTLAQGTVPNQVIWKRASTYVKQESLEAATSMGAFVGANYDSMSSLNK